MPYISAGDRPMLDAKVEALSIELATDLVKRFNGDTDISLCYKESILAIVDTLRQLEEGNDIVPHSQKDQLAQAIFESAKRHAYRGAWLGSLDYALTRLIQSVPAKMVANGIWKESFRFWIYAQTIGALERAAITVHSQGKNDCVTDGIVGVLTDVKDEYKRRVNVAYEAVQIRKSGDCYNTRYRTEVVEVKDSSDKVIGYEEIMKDFGAEESY